jgi:DegV family protein with EDD domain
MSPSKPAKVRIVTDTTSCLPLEVARRHSIEVVPQVIRFESESFLEDVEISLAEFVRRLRLAKTLPSTAAPLVGDFVAAYQRQLAAAETILSIHPSGEVSGTVRSALTARETAFPQADIRVIDTRTVAGNLAALALSAAKAAEAGESADGILRRIQADIPRSRTYFVVATLEYLQKGGRIGGASALIGGALQIKPILEILDGRVEVREKVRTHQRAMGRLLEIVTSECPRSADARLSVSHADAEEAARRLASELRAALALEEVSIYPVGSAITTHAGPGTLAVGFFGESR